MWGRWFLPRSLPLWCAPSGLSLQFSEAFGYGIHGCGLFFLNPFWLAVGWLVLRSAGGIRGVLVFPSPSRGAYGLMGS